MRSKVLIGIMLVASSCLETEAPPSFYDQLAKDMQVIDNYLADNPPGPNDLVVKDASGVRLVISTLGTGTIPPNTANTLKIAYTGRLLSNGSVFDSNPSYILKLTDVIDGWKLGIALLTKGAKAKLYVPSGLGYGANGSGSIPSNANLVFDIELIEVVSTAQQISKLAADTVAIDAYLATNGIAAQKDKSGIRYVMTQVGTGITPTLYDGVKVKLSARLMTTGEVILTEQIVEPNGGFSSRVANYPHGALVGLQLMAEGGKATFYIPYILANNLTGVPSTSNVIMEMELLDVVNE